MIEIFGIVVTRKKELEEVVAKTFKEAKRLSDELVACTEVNERLVKENMELKRRVEQFKELLERERKEKIMLYDRLKTVAKR
jgi:regulator of replication initiation timing